MAPFTGPFFASADAQEQTYKRFQEINFGFAFEIPVSWNIKLTPKKDYLIEGPKGSDAFEIGIIIQIIKKSQNPKSSAELQLNKAEKQVMTLPGAELVKTDRVPMANQKAPFFVARYNTKTTQGNTATFGHTQVVLDQGDYYYWISFSGPLPIYDKYLPVLERLLGSFSFR
jgi:hypothetical protein